MTYERRKIKATATLASLAMAILSATAATFIATFATSWFSTLFVVLAVFFGALCVPIGWLVAEAIGGES